jgi:hypothetical protein
LTDLRRFLDACQAAIEARRTEIALANGISRDRVLDQYRFAAGQCAGLTEAATILDAQLKKLTEEEAD